jgi:acetyl esterase/lipase
MKLFYIPFFLFMITTACAQIEIPLYKTTIPNGKPSTNKEYRDTAAGGILIVHNISEPTLTIFQPPKEKQNGTAVIIVPGGGYSIVAIGHEGYDVAKRFNEMGVTAFVLKYRIPNDSTMEDKSIGPLQDAQRAIQIVRENAKKWHVNKNAIGILGFSAGGHLASTAGTHYNLAVIPNRKKISLRPDFMVLVYPVISFMDTLVHQGSRDNLLGKNAQRDKIQLYSNELQVNQDTPPTFLVHAKDDGAVKFENSELLYEALKRSGVPAEIYLFDKGGHGFGMNNPTSNVKWMDLVQEWLTKRGLVKAEPIR